MVHENHIQILAKEVCDVELGSNKMKLTNDSTKNKSNCANTLQKKMA